MKKPTEILNELENRKLLKKGKTVLIIERILSSAGDNSQPRLVCGVFVRRRIKKPFKSITIRKLCVLMNDGTLLELDEEYGIMTVRRIKAADIKTLQGQAEQVLLWLGFSYGKNGTRRSNNRMEFARIFQPLPRDVRSAFSAGFDIARFWMS